MKNAVATSAVALRAEAARLVLLERGDKLALTPIDRAGAVESLMALDPGFDLLEEESREAIGQLASGGAWTLTLERDPRAAIDFLAGRLPLVSFPPPPPPLPPPPSFPNPPFHPLSPSPPTSADGS